MRNYLSTRRIFLQRGLTILAAAPTIPTFLDQTMMALAAPLDGARTQQASGKDGKILVVIQMSGGNDGLSTVVPFGDDAYYRKRTAIAHEKKSLLKINDYVGLHPALTPFKALYDEGQLGIVQGVGYPNPNRSHFRSMDIWNTAEPEKEISTNGWIGRYFDATCPGVDPHVGMSIGERLPIAMQGSRVTPLAFEKPENYAYKGKDKDRYRELNSMSMDHAEDRAATEKMQKARASVKKVVTPDAQLDFLTRTAMDAQVSSDKIASLIKNHQAPVAYPRGEFGEGLRTIAAMIKGNMPTRVYYVSLGGFDTHANQRGKHDQLMQAFAQGVDAFTKDLRQQENEDRVLVMSFSEFGRRVDQNASSGTDHGAAAPMFLIGPKIKPGLIGQHPSLTDLDQGDLKFTTDFRNVYATVLQNWLDTPSKPILGRQFNPLPVLG